MGLELVGRQRRRLVALLLVVPCPNATGTPSAGQPLVRSEPASPPRRVGRPGKSAYALEVLPDGSAVSAAGVVPEISVTEPDTSRAEASARSRPHSSAHDDDSKMWRGLAQSFMESSGAHRADASQPSDEELMRLGDGVGSVPYNPLPTDSRALNHDLRMRMELQDKATLVLLLVAFFIALAISLLSVYQVAKDPSPVLFYTDPTLFRQRLTCATADVSAFLQAFNTQPENARLRLIGRNAAPERGEGFLKRLLVPVFCRRRSQQNLGPGQAAAGQGQGHSQGTWDPVRFDIALDLAPFISGDDGLRSEADLAVLEQHLESRNTLQLLRLCKTIEWDGWEDIATNIRQRLRAVGFDGEVSIFFEAGEEMIVYRNHPWQNFLRSRVTQVLMLLSVVGSLAWLPYLWCRVRTVKVETRFHIRVNHARYWDHLSEGLDATVGFRG